MPLSGWPASCLLPAHPTGVFPIRILCSEGMCVGFAFGGTLVLQYFCPRQLLLLCVWFYLSLGKLVQC